MIDIFFFNWSKFDQMLTMFRDQDSEAALEANIDGNLRGSYPLEEAYKVRAIAIISIYLTLQALSAFCIQVKTRQAS